MRLLVWEKGVLMHPKAGPGNATLLSVLAALALGACGVGEEPNTGSSGSQLQAQWTDFPAKSHRPTRDAVTGVTEKYFGGPIVPNPKVYVVWWGSAASINANLTRTTGGIADFFAGTLNTGYWDMLNEYSTNINAQAGSHVGQAGTGQFLGRGNYARTIAMTNIPTGTQVHCVEMQPGRGGQLGRSAGTAIQLMAKDNGYALLRMPSGEMRQVLETCYATIGVVGNAEHQQVKLGKAGRTRHRGRRPQVRGSVMNPVDHPHGGGEGKTSGGRHPVNPNGKPEGRTRKANKASDKFIVRRRKTGKKR